MKNIDPKQLFLIDFIGASCSCIFLGFLLPLLEGFTGVPSNILYLFAFTALLLAAYSSISFRIYPKNWQQRMKVIGTLNFLYCGLTIFFLMRHRETILPFGWAYFSIELIIVFFLSRWEIRTSRSEEAAS